MQSNSDSSLSERKINLVWRRSQTEAYDLKLLNREELNKDRLEALLNLLDATTHRKRHLRTEARVELRNWLEDPSQPLSSECYVLVSNWFLTNSGDRKSMVARHCEELWDELFACRPEARLSSPSSGENHIIIPQRFESFYKKLIDAQNDESIPNKSRGNIVPMENEDQHQDFRRYSILTEMRHLEAAFFAELNEMLTKKGQLILEGSPGSGKTFVAEHFGRFLAYGEEGYSSWVEDPINLADSNRQRFEVVQFHESYGYEDFMEGFRPKTENGIMVFERQSGIFKRFCDEARGKPGHYVMLIDEINRGKPSKIFGELLYLLEYREKEVRLSSGEIFKIPRNVLLIGTMNTADKSIALVDYALRRRFVFVPLRPVEKVRGSPIQVSVQTVDLDGDGISLRQ